MTLNVNDINFVVDNGIVSLCVGPFAVEVAETADEFADFVDSLVAQLNTIRDEMRVMGYLSQ